MSYTSNGSRYIFADNLRPGTRLDLEGLGRDIEVRSVAHIGESPNLGDYATVIAVEIGGETEHLSLDPQSQLRLAIPAREARIEEAKQILARYGEERNW